MEAKSLSIRLRRKRTEEIIPFPDFRRKTLPYSRKSRASFDRDIKSNTESRPFAAPISLSRPDGVADCQVCHSSIGRIDVFEPDSLSGPRLHLTCAACTLTRQRFDTSPASGKSAKTGKIIKKIGRGRPHNSQVDSRTKSSVLESPSCRFCGIALGRAAPDLWSLDAKIQRDIFLRSLACTQCSCKYQYCLGCQNFSEMHGCFRPHPLFESPNACLCRLPHSLDSIMASLASTSKGSRGKNVQHNISNHFELFDLTSRGLDQALSSDIITQIRVLYESHLTALNARPEILDLPHCTYSKTVQAQARQSIETLFFSHLSMQLPEGFIRCLTVCYDGPPSSHSRETRNKRGSTQGTKKRQIVGFSVLDWEILVGIVHLQTLAWSPSLSFGTISESLLPLLIVPFRACQDSHEGFHISHSSTTPKSTLYTKASTRSHRDQGRGIPKVRFDATNPPPVQRLVTHVRSPSPIDHLLTKLGFEAMTITSDQGSSGKGSSKEWSVGLETLKREWGIKQQ